MHKDYQHLFEGRTFTVSTGRWQMTVTDVPQKLHGATPFRMADEEELSREWLVYRLTFTDNLGNELKLKLYVEVGSIEGYRDLSPLLRQEIDIWLGNPERRPELVVGPSGPIW